MKLEDIKVGETYNVRVKVEHIDEDGWIKVRTNEKSISFILAPREAEFISPLPKYDPCREFMNGDKVRMVMRDGRYPYCMQKHEQIVPTDTICTVVRCELNGFVAVEYNNGYNPVVHFSFLELVTPVEELEPYYYVAKNDGVHPTFLVRNRNEEHRVAAICECWNEEDAQRICDMYNAEYRKEKK